MKKLYLVAVSCIFGSDEINPIKLKKEGQKFLLEELSLNGILEEVKEIEDETDIPEVWRGGIPWNIDEKDIRVHAYLDLYQQKEKEKETEYQTYLSLKAKFEGLKDKLEEDDSQEFLYPYSKKLSGHQLEAQSEPEVKTAKIVCQDCLPTEGT